MDFIGDLDLALLMTFLFFLAGPELEVLDNGLFTAFFFGANNRPFLETERDLPNRFPGDLDFFNCLGFDTDLLLRTGLQELFLLFVDVFGADLAALFFNCFFETLRMIFATFLAFLLVFLEPLLLLRLRFAGFFDLVLLTVFGFRLLTFLGLLIFFTLESSPHVHGSPSLFKKQLKNCMIYYH